MKPTPNILLIVTDQHRADHVGFGGNDVIRTPNLDALAARGTVFDRCYVTNPICMPNRSTMLTGRVPTSHGVIFNDRSLPWNVNTFPRVLRRAGYRTALIGKSHLQHGLSEDSRAAETAAPGAFDPFEDGWDRWEHPDRYEAGEVEVPEDFYGFDHVEFSIGHGDVIAGHHYRWALAHGGDPSVIRGNWGEKRAALERFPDWWQVYQPAVPEELYSTTFVAERCSEWIRDAAGGDAPWLLQCSFPDPHHPFTPPGKWWDAYDPEEMAVPDTIDDPLTDAPKHLHAIRGLKPGRNPVQMFGATPEIVKHARAAEYGMIEMIDDAVGRVLSTLEQSGAADDTIVIFTSDHGDMFGDHGLMLKGWMHYQGTLRVPFVVARPGQTPARTRALASTIDLAQTVLDLCGQAPFLGMQGESLRPLLDGERADVRDHVFIEDDFPNARGGGFLPEKTRTLITDEGRLTRYSTGEVELFDLEKDPDEMQNLAGKPAGADRRAHLHERLAESMLRYADDARLG